MKISIIGPGIMPIPPVGWGAVESLIWDYKIELERLGHNVQIANNSNSFLNIEEINNFEPDFVHLQYDDFANILPFIKCPYKAITSHYGYIEQFQKHPEYHNILKSFIDGDFYIFCLSESIANVYKSLGINPERLKVTPNGARSDAFKYNEICSLPDKSIYLAKIDYRKRQYLFQDLDFIDFVGNNHDSRFNGNLSNYLGEWSKETLYNNLTNYGNLVLLSDGEADPLVTKEAMMAGLGLVISEYATANLDLNLPFISVIEEGKINDIEYVSKIINSNRELSVSMRNDIRKYALENVSWEVVVPKYVNTIQSLLN